LISAETIDCSLNLTGYQPKGFPFLGLLKPGDAGGLESKYGNVVGNKRLVLSPVVSAYSLTLWAATDYREG
jgi:hypothetical protein